LDRLCGRAGFARLGAISDQKNEFQVIFQVILRLVASLHFLSAKGNKAMKLKTNVKAGAFDSFTNFGDIKGESSG